MTRMSAKRTDAAPAAAILVLVCVAQFMVIVDETIVNVALPSIATDLRFSESGLSWVANAYILTFGGFLLVGGKVADVLGRRRVFLASTVAFGLTSLACALAPSANALVIARAVQGIAAAFMSPSALGILLATFRGDQERSRALGIWAALAGLGAAMGLLMGGALVELDWRWVFWINLPIALATTVAVLRVVPDQASEDARGAPDLTGAMLATAALLLLVYTVVETNEHGWGSTRTVGGLAVAVLLFTTFVVRERRAREPLVPNALLRIRRVVAANALAMLVASGLLAMFFFLTLYMQVVLGYSALQTGVAYLPFSAGVAIASGAATKLLERSSPGPLLIAGPLIGAIGLWLMSRLEPTSSYSSHLLPALVIVGVGLGMTLVPTTFAATEDVDVRDSGVASGLLTTSQQIGAALGIGILVTIASGRTSDALADGSGRASALVDGFQVAFTIAAAVLAASALVGALTFRSAQARTQAPAQSSA